MSSAPSETAFPCPLPPAEAAAGSQPRSPRRPDREQKALVVVGNGMASHRLCDRLSQLAGLRDYQVTVIGEEPHPAYDRVHLTRRFEGAPAESLLLASRQWYADRGITLLTGESVLAIDRHAHAVRTVNGRQLAYDRLVLATGSRAYCPPLPGSDLSGVFIYRTLEDLDGILARAAQSERAAVIGGGLLGLEAARALQARGLQTWVVERGITLLARQLGPSAGELLRQQVERLGLRVLTSRETIAIEALGDDRLLQFRDGEALRVQLVVLAVGIRPRDELAVASRLAIGPRGGVAIDDALRTSDPAVYAIGECACHRGVVHGLAGPAFRMAETLAAVLMGQRARFTGADHSTWLKVPGISVATLGDYQAEANALTSTAPGAYRQLVLHRGRLIGAVAVGEWPEQHRIHEAIANRRRIWRWQRARFLRTARLWPDRPALPVGDWPETALVCNCLAVRRGALSAVLNRGERTVEALVAATGASTVCGSCRPLLAELAGLPPVPAQIPGRHLLGLGASAAALLAFAIAVLPRIPLHNTVQGAGLLDPLWRLSAWRQTTGFALLGVVALGLAFSLRKRLSRLRWGEVGHWRALHALLGAGALVLLVTHTGLRLGQNLNRVLMLDFLALALLGAGAGLVAALEHRFPGPGGRRLRAAWNFAHVLLVWPLPVLLLFHILTAYYF